MSTTAANHQGATMYGCRERREGAIIYSNESREACLQVARDWAACFITVDVVDLDADEMGNR